MTPSRDPQDSPTMREVRRIRESVYEASRNRTPEQQSEAEAALLHRWGLRILPPAVAEQPNAPTRKTA